jgi:hypothetical protein
MKVCKLFELNASESTGYELTEIRTRNQVYQKWIQVLIGNVVLNIFVVNKTIVL